MPFWRTNRADSGNNTEYDEQSDAGGRAPEPPSTEYTRLLPHRVDTDTHQYLSPDDPAVTPYNLWTVRALRWVTVVLVVITLVWWIMQLIMPFTTPPGLHVPTSGFLSFGYASVALAEVLFGLVFFGVPSRAVRVLACVVSTLLLADAIIIVSVSQLRYEEGWGGVATALWALLMALWTVLTDRAVQWGKAEEEERLTGRPETRRSFVEWLEVLLSTIAQAILALAALLITLNLVLRSLDAAVAAPGERYPVDGDKYRIHLYCRGNVTDEGTGEKVPTVLFEAGWDAVEDSLWRLADDALQNGTIQRYCFADRPGMGWSDTAPSPFSAGVAADALSEALAKAGERGPWVLASTGIGSVYSRVFSARHGRDVVGLLLVDPFPEDLLYRIGNPARGFRLWLDGALSPLGILRLPGALFMGQSSRNRIYGKAARHGGKHILARLQESLVAESLTRREVESSRAIQDKGVALALVSGRERMERDDEWRRGQEKMKDVTEKLVGWDVVDRSGGGGKRGKDLWEDDEGRKVVLGRLGELARRGGNGTV